MERLACPLGRVVRHTSALDAKGPAQAARSGHERCAGLAQRWYAHAPGEQLQAGADGAPTTGALTVDEIGSTLVSTGTSIGGGGACRVGGDRPWGRTARKPRSEAPQPGPGSGGHVVRNRPERVAQCDERDPRHTPASSPAGRGASSEVWQISAANPAVLAGWPRPRRRDRRSPRGMRPSPPFQSTQFLHPFLSHVMFFVVDTQWSGLSLVSKPHPVLPPLVPVCTSLVGTCSTAIIYLPVGIAVFSCLRQAGFTPPRGGPINDNSTPPFFLWLSGRRRATTKVIG